MRFNNICLYNQNKNTTFAALFSCEYNTIVETINNNNKINTTMAYVISDDCVACGTCIDECPMGAISEGDKYSIDPEACTECGTCADVCPSAAISK